MRYGKLSVLLILGTLAAARAEVKLTGDTSRPNVSLFPLGENIELTFKASGLKSDETLTLALDIVDQNGRTLKKVSVPVAADTNGTWTGRTADVPCDRMGFYRVLGQLSNGVKIGKLGSRPEGCLTYAVVPPPEERKLFFHGGDLFRNVRRLQ